MNKILKNSGNASVHQHTFYHMAFNHKDGTRVHTHTHSQVIWDVMASHEIHKSYICKFTVTFGFSAVQMRAELDFLLKG